MKKNNLSIFFNFNLKNFYRDYFEKNPTINRSSGIIVEMNETVIIWRKYNRKRLIEEEQWFFGEFERENRKAYINSSNSTIIQEHVRTGSLIISDLWKSYYKIRKLPKCHKYYKKHKKLRQYRIWCLHSLHVGNSSIVINKKTHVVSLVSYLVFVAEKV